VRIDTLQEGVHLVTARFGFMETPDVSVALKNCRARGLKLFGPGLLILPRLAPGGSAATSRLPGIPAAHVSRGCSGAARSGGIFPHAGQARDRAGDPGRALKLSIIAALADNGVIGRGGALPWHLPDDLRRFKSLTMGHPIPDGPAHVRSRSASRCPEGATWC